MEKYNLKSQYPSLPNSFPVGRLIRGKIPVGFVRLWITSWGTEYIKGQVAHERQS